eukprot:g7192.t1
MRQVDNLTYALGLAGYNASKLLVFGQIHEVLPCLRRRTRENRDAFGAQAHELPVLRNEIRRRLLGRLGRVPRRLTGVMLSTNMMKSCSTVEESDFRAAGEYGILPGDLPEGSPNLKAEQVMGLPSPVVLGWSLCIFSVGVVLGRRGW